MKDVLEEIVAYKRIEIEQMKREVSESELHQRVERLMMEEDGRARRSMREALINSKTGIIAEFKRKSPSKGWIKEDGRADIIPQAYQDNGATALSILTDNKYFGGCDEFIRTARGSVTIPILYKNFVIDEYQLFQARLCGADATLLIAADLKKEECRTLIQTAHEIGLEVLLEIHHEKELDYIDFEPDMCGVNNRNLGTFVTDVDNSFRLAGQLPEEMVKVSESGISNPETVRKLRQAGFKGFLIGENFMKAACPGAALKRIHTGNRMIIKICGMREADNIRDIEEIGPDLMGFIFWEGTKRNVESLPEYMPSRCKRVGVFVDADEDFISTHVKKYQLGFVQLHGHETPAFCERLHQVLPDIKIIKAISVKDTDDIRNANSYNGVVDYFVFDTKCKCVGGSGEQFDWDILKYYRNDIPFLLSGGIGPDDAERVKAFKHPMMIGIDLNSRFELSPALKDAVTLKEFINNIR